MEVDVLFVGGGIASLSGALHLADLVAAHKKKGEGKKLDELLIVVLEKGASPGAHGISGAVMAPGPLQELVPDFIEKGAPLEGEVKKESVYFLTKTGKIRSPITPPPLNNHGNYVVSMSKLNQWLAGLCEKRGINIFPEFAGTEVLYGGERVIGVRTGDKGLDAQGNKKGNYEPGTDLHARVTVLGEGSRGNLTKDVIARFKLDAGKNPPGFELGVKEVWELPETRLQPGEVVHTMGYPLKSDAFGGGFLYGMKNNQVAVGHLTSLDYADPFLDPHREFQKFKLHPLVSGLLKDGKLVQYGAKSVPVGGYFSVPELVFPGGMLIGDGGNLFNAQKIKGIDLAIRSGIMAAETIFTALLEDDFSDARLAGYAQAMAAAGEMKELRRVRNFHQAMTRGLWRGLATAGAQFFLGGRVWSDLVAEVGKRGPAFGESRSLRGEKFIVEFVSANPTGPLVVANARAAAFGDSLCRCLEAAGASVRREYYVNDAGMQVRNLALSVTAMMAKDESRIPEDGYRGQYVSELADSTATALSLKMPITREPSLDKVKAHILGDILQGQKEDLEFLGVRFDDWFKESALHARGDVDTVQKELEAAGLTKVHENAVWLRATEWGDEKDRVIRKADGQPTYLLPDIAYHLDKFGRAGRLITIVGADHQTEMGVLSKALEMLGKSRGQDLGGRLEVVIVQFVHLKRGTEKVVMSKRSGAIVTLRELVAEVGKDAARFFFLMRAPSSHLDFDLELAKKTTEENPVYYIQYAHARLCSLVKFAEEKGVKPAAVPAPADLAEPEARLVLRKMARYPLVVEKAAAGRMPHILTHEMLELARAVHQFYTKHRVVGAPTPALESARLALLGAARQVLVNGLVLLGVSAPERM